VTMSLNRRLLLAASVVLAAFFGITGLVLERAYRHSAEQAVFDRLQGQVIALIAALEQHDDGTVYLANALAETRFFTPDSGLYGQVVRNDHRDSWRSLSLSGDEIIAASLARGQQRLYQTRLKAGLPVFVFSLGISWDDKAVFDRGYTFTVAEHRQAFDEQIAAFRRLLWGWLAAVAAGLLLVQGSILRWGLAPLRRVAVELMQINNGRQQRLQQDYPQELRGLTANLNALLETQRLQLQRYRHALGDLAHSLKTPLALVRGDLESSRPQQALVREQIDHMVQIVDYQLQRAAAAGRTALATPVSVAAVAGKVMDALDKVYYDKGMSAECLVDADLQVQVDRQDLMELLGNLLDNAYKYGRHRLLLTAEVSAATDRSGPVFECCVEDDGPGIDEHLREHVLQRGTRIRPDVDGRADETGAATVGGQGIGLAVVQDIVAAYAGRLSIDRGRWQGARICVYLPLMDMPA